MIIKAKSYPRAGLVGNPSDGYHGKTISFTFSNFCAEVVLYHTPKLEIIWSTRDQSSFDSLRELVDDVNLYGYYGGIRLLKATCKRFWDYCRNNQIELDDRNFTLQYSSGIPHGVGLAGSSAIITACLQALMKYYGVSIPKPIQANLALSAETDELHISAGLQDRVIQAYQGLVHMDFDKALMDKQGYGRYEELDPSLLPPLYIAYRTDLAECSDVVHNKLRHRYNRGEKSVLAAIGFWAGLADKVRKALLDGQPEKLGPLLDSNFDRRAKLCPLSEGNLRMVEAARSVGASAKFTGSGGAIVGTYDDAKMFNELRKRLKQLRIKVLKPRIAMPSRKGKL